jgi:hypothetical protein
MLLSEGVVHHSCGEHGRASASLGLNCTLASKRKWCFAPWYQPLDHHNRLNAGNSETQLRLLQEMPLISIVDDDESIRDATKSLMVG